MNNNTVTFKIKEWTRGIDWKLLIFLLLFLNVKLAVKIAAVILAYVLRPDFRFGIHLKKSRIPLFYFLIMGIAVLNWILSGVYTDINYDLTVLTGFFFWILCILAFQQIRVAVENNPVENIHRTIMVFFLINAIFSFAVYLAIMWDAGSMNPYRYQGQFQKYFMGTGDYIKGVTLDTSTTNSVLNAFAVVYFLLRNQFKMLLLCMAVLVLTGSNTTNLLLLGAFIFLFIFKSNKPQKSLIVICLAILIAFLAGISPQNNTYVEGAWQKMFGKTTATHLLPAKIIPLEQRPDSSLSPAEKKQKLAHAYLDSMYVLIHQKDFTPASAVLSPNISLSAKPLVVKDDIHSAGFQHKNDTTVLEKNLIKFVKEKKTDLPISGTAIPRPRIPGKLISFKQTLTYLKSHPATILTGTGIGNFSSKLAFRVTAMKIAGSYPQRFAYINDAFKKNHLDLYLYYFTNVDDLHSIANSPNSTYDQLLSEYGIAGLACFVIFYIGFFTKHLKKLTYGIPLLLLMAGCFLFEYWFEQLSIVIFFELLLLLNIKETNPNAAA
ncbi:MAG: hypothetical protein ABJA78_02110 [Ferruginibacter sp.]